jgi:HEAT repeat protein
MSAASPRDLPKVTTLIETLTAPGLDTAAWEAAQQELSNLGAAAVPGLIAELQSSLEVRRELAAATLAELGDAAVAAAPALRSALADPSRFVRANAAAALVQMPDHRAQAMPALVALLNESDPQVRQLAATNLAALGADAQGQVPQLLQALDHADAPEVLTPVVELLGRIGTPAQPAVPRLRRISEEHPDELGSAARAAIQLIIAESPAGGN